MTIITTIFWFFIGLCISEYIQLVSDRGSFLSSMWGRSQCDHCKKELPYWVLIPFIGLFLTKYRCFYCKKLLDSRYIWFEILFAVGWAVTLYILAAYTLLTPVIVISALLAYSFSALLMYEDYKNYSVPVIWLLAAIVFYIVYWYLSGHTNLYFFDIIILFIMIMFSLLVVRVLKRNVVRSFSGMFGLADLIVLIMFCLLLGYVYMMYILIATAVFSLGYLLFKQKLHGGQRLPLLTFLLPWAFWALILLP